MNWCRDGEDTIPRCQPNVLWRFFPIEYQHLWSRFCFAKQIRALSILYMLECRNDVWVCPESGSPLTCMYREGQSGSMQSLFVRTWFRWPAWRFDQPVSYMHALWNKGGSAQKPNSASFIHVYMHSIANQNCSWICWAWGRDAPNWTREGRICQSNAGKKSWGPCLIYWLFVFCSTNMVCERFLVFFIVGCLRVNWSQLGWW